MTIEELTRPKRSDEDKIEQLKALFPEAFNDGVFNIEALKNEVRAYNNNLISDFEDEYYALNWTGKSDAKKLTFQPAEGTLRFNSEDGINEDTTNNIVIEGDNLEVLRILQKSYSNKVKCIYIDPPYNTGKDFVYKDDFKDPVEKYLYKTNQADEDGMLTSNPKANGRYHANWLNMMYPRLKLARNLLKDDGVIFVSIDDNEHANLKKLMDEIFGEENFIASIAWQKNYSPRNDAIYFSDMHDYVLIYAKIRKNKKTDSFGWTRNLLPRSEKQTAMYKNLDGDVRGPWKSENLSVKSYSKDYDYPIITPGGREVWAPKGRCWMTSKTNFEKLVSDNRIWFGKDGNNVPSLKKFLSEVQSGTVPVTWWTRDEHGDNEEATKELRKIFEDTGVPFETPKPVRLIKKILQIATNKDNNDIVLDFFAGSGTTGQAVMEMNAEDGGNRKYLLIQLPVPIEDENYPTIAEVTKERLRRVIKNDEVLSQDGFKVFSLNNTNINKWSANIVENLNKLEYQMDIFVSKPFRENSSEQDIVVEMMLLQGFPLDSEYKLIKLKNNNIWVVKHSSIPFALVVCLDTKLNVETAKHIASSYEKATLICTDRALNNDQKVLLSESLTVKTI